MSFSIWFLSVLSSSSLFFSSQNPLLFLLFFFSVFISVLLSLPCSSLFSCFSSLSKTFLFFYPPLFFCSINLLSKSLSLSTVLCFSSSCFHPFVISSKISPPSHFLLPSFIYKGRGKAATLPPSNHRGRVGWLAWPLCSCLSRPKGMTPLSNLHHGGGWEAWVVSRFGQVGRERERECVCGVARERNFFFPCLCVSRGWRSTMPFKTTLFCASSFSFFFETKHDTTPFFPKHAVSFKRKRHQNMLMSKSVLNLWFVQSSL